jgi:hypothetical protein
MLLRQGLSDHSPADGDRGYDPAGGWADPISGGTIIALATGGVSLSKTP